MKSITISTTMPFKRVYQPFYWPELFIASLALNNIRLENISLTLLLGGLLVIWELPNILKNIRSAFYSYDMVFIAYIFIAILNLRNTDNIFVVIKTLSYYSCFIAFRFSLVSQKEPLRVLRRGAIWGSILFVGTIIFAFANGSIVIADLYSFSYDRITVGLYRDLVASSDVSDFEGRDILRNTIAEVHAFYYMILLNAGKVLICGIPGAGIFLFQSRRAALSAAISTIFIGAISWQKAVIVLAATGIFLAYSAYAQLLNFETRFSSVASEGRMLQYIEAFRWIQLNPILGYGYGEQVFDKYVHNFFLSSWFMMGFPGLCAASAVIIYLLTLFKGTGGYRWLLMIPLFDMAVGSAVEGMFTLTSWASIAILILVKRTTAMPTH